MRVTKRAKQWTESEEEKRRASVCAGGTEENRDRDLNSRAMYSTRRKCNAYNCPQFVNTESFKVANLSRIPS